MTPQSSGPSLFLIEAAVTAILVGLAFLFPRLGCSWFRAAERGLGRLARRRALTVAAVGSVACLARLAVQPLMPVPHPFVHDEFSHLLAGETFAMGRLTNPTPALWEHFESFHIILHPSYMSMYFPAQGMFLAAGIKLLGHPWFGVWLSAGLMCSAVCWMLQGWFTPGWALFGGVLAVIRLGVFSYWMNAYHGGAVPAVGGALVLGALARIIRHKRIRDAFWMGAGLALLALSRPYEGLLVAIPVGLYLALWAAWQRPLAVVFRRVALPLASVLALTGAFMAYYSWRITGSALTTAYEVNRSTYAVARQFVWQPPRPEPAYHHKVMRDYYVSLEFPEAQKAGTLSGFLDGCLAKAGISLFFFFGFLLMPALCFLPWTLRDRRMRFVVVAIALLAAGLAVNFYMFPHYAAPGTALIYILLVQCLRHLRVWRPARQPVGRFLVRAIPVVCILLCGIRAWAAPLGVTVERFPAMWYGTAPLGVARAQVCAELSRLDGDQLAIVRYVPQHNPLNEWVYNEPDMDHAKVVWAREMDAASNQELIRYFSRRKVWLVEPDCKPPKISPYSADGKPEPER